MEFPEELQELVFARLPWPQIYRVRILSKGWNQKLMSAARDSQFKRACVRAQPKSFALLAPAGDSPGSFTVNMFDVASNQWHTFETASPEYDPKCGEIQGMSASDGGLVCFFSKVQPKSNKNPRFVFVCNPLTREWKQLPPLCGLVQRKIMVKLTMDRETMRYRVIVVGHSRDRKLGILVNVYHSETGQWTVADGSSSGEVVYGYLYYFKYFNSNRSACSYNPADGLVRNLIATFPEDYEDGPGLVKEHLFLRKDVESADELPTLCIEEFQAVDGGASWTPLKEYPFNRFPRIPGHIEPYKISWCLDFLACKDFLLLYVLNQLEEDNRHYFLWLYEFSGEEWRELPTMPGGNDRLFLAQKQICELRFESVP